MRQHSPGRSSFSPQAHGPLYGALIVPSGLLLDFPCNRRHHVVALCLSGTTRLPLPYAPQMSETHRLIE